jgi:DNA-binding protein HU-beta
MNKAELIEAIANESGLSKADAKRAVDGFVATTAKALKKGDRISLVGFGSFSISKRAARKGRNPQTGKEIKIAAKNVVRFKAGADLTTKVNK